MGERDLQELDLQSLPSFKTPQSFIKMANVHKQAGAKCTLLVHSRHDFTSTLFLSVFFLFFNVNSNFNETNHRVFKTPLPL